MAGIKDAIKDVLALLSDMPESKYVAVWNNQTKTVMDGKMEAFPLPAMLLETVTPTQMSTIGCGVWAGDVKFRIHLLHEFYDAQDGTMGQNLDVFDIKRAIVKKLSFATPSGCSALQLCSEQQSNDHENVYEYLIEFATHFIDNEASGWPGKIQKMAAPQIEADYVPDLSTPIDDDKKIVQP